MGAANTIVAMMSAPPDLEHVVRDYFEAADWTRAIPSGTHPSVMGETIGRHQSPG
jgi:hypothetical protein